LCFAPSTVLDCQLTHSSSQLRQRKPARNKKRVWQSVNVRNQQRNIQHYFSHLRLKNIDINSDLFLNFKYVEVCCSVSAFHNVRRICSGALRHNRVSEIGRQSENVVDVADLDAETEQERHEPVSGSRRHDAGLQRVLGVVRLFSVGQLGTLR